MIRNMRSALKVLGVVVALIALGTGVSAAGDAGAVFNLGISARSLGVGGARTSFPSSPGLNPAALGWEKSIGFSSLYVRQFGGIEYGAVAFSAPYVGIAALFLDSGWIESGDGGFRYASQGLTCATGIPLGPISVGGQWRFLHIGAPFTGAGWTADLAALVDLGQVRVGVIADSIVSRPVKYDLGKTETWAPDLAIGAAITLEPFEEVSWTATVEADGLLGARWRLIGGIEVWVGPLAGRLGWDGAGPTFGLSVKVREVGVDWSCAARSDLGTSHRVSLEVLF